MITEDNLATVVSTFLSSSPINLKIDETKMDANEDIAVVNFVGYKVMIETVFDYQESLMIIVVRVINGKDPITFTFQGPLGSTNYLAQMWIAIAATIDLGV